MVPVGLFKVETVGRGRPAGHTVRYASDAVLAGIAVKFSEYACAFAGNPQPVLEDREVGFLSAGQGCPWLRVSARRQGVGSG